jgi:sigma-B regulation protein RsbU (phosphoserine phosphatase)
MSVGYDLLRAQLEDRRRRLKAVSETEPEPTVLRLLQEVDQVLSGFDGGTFGECLVCHTEIDAGDLARNPAMRYCLCHLTDAQQRALERDLALARTIQTGLLPVPEVAHAGFSAHYRYAPAGPVSGDFCDLVPAPNGDGALFFAIGDVSGKGIAASLLMAHLSAAFRASVEGGAHPDAIVQAADRMLLARGFASHYATVAYGRAPESGPVEIANAGHCPPLHVRRRSVEPIRAAGLPIGVFGDAPRGTVAVALDPGDLLVLFTDGVTELRNADDEEFGLERLVEVVAPLHGAAPREAAERAIATLRAFAEGQALHDDLTLLVLRRD